MASAIPKKNVSATSQKPCFEKTNARQVVLNSEHYTFYATRKTSEAAKDSQISY